MQEQLARVGEGGDAVDVASGVAVIGQARRARHVCHPRYERRAFSMRTGLAPGSGSERAALLGVTSLPCSSMSNEHLEHDRRFEGDVAYCLARTRGGLVAVPADELLAQALKRKWTPARRPAASRAKIGPLSRIQESSSGRSTSRRPRQAWPEPRRRRHRWPTMSRLEGGDGVGDLGVVAPCRL